ncbi:MAG: glycosyltransferase family 4 protein [Candidatus Nealsonbacteria bacterium]|nr:glycosyltransferase family 4 protein [Candidatus Nealsonbacteria bacterium]
MKSLILYAYPPDSSGLSLQGDMLYRGMKENGEEVMPCHWEGKLQKEWIYNYFQPDVAIGVGYWGYTPEIILHPQKFGITPVPWLIADGWVANYHDVLNGLPLIFVTSEWVKKTYERDGVDTKNFEVAHVGIEPDLFKSIPKTDPRIKKLRQMLGVGPDEKLILTVGGDVTSKGAQEVLKALALINPEFSKWKYVCKSWGGDCFRGHLKEELGLIKELGLEKEKILHFEGQNSREFMPYLLNAADIYAAPSRLEGFGMIQVEAQACGIPVVSIDAMGPKETIIHNETGFLAKVESTVNLESELVYPEMGFEKETRIFFDKPKTFAHRASVEDLAKYLLILLTDEKKRIEMGKEARVHALKNFHYRDIAAFMTARIKARLGLK